MNDEGYSNCPFCREEMVVPIDLSVGPKQKYIQDCPKCSYPSVIHVEVESDGDVRVWVTAK